MIALEIIVHLDHKQVGAGGVANTKGQLHLPFRGNSISVGTDYINGVVL